MGNCKTKQKNDSEKLFSPNVNQKNSVEKQNKYKNMTVQERKWKIQRDELSSVYCPMKEALQQILHRKVVWKILNKYAYHFKKKQIVILNDEILNNEKMDSLLTEQTNCEYQILLNFMKELGDESVKRIFRRLEKLRFIPYLQLRFKEINLEKIEILKKGLASLREVQELKIEMHMNSLTGEKVKLLGEGIQKLRMVRVLYLKINDTEVIQVNSGRILGESLKEMYQIQELNLEIKQNNLENAGLQELMSGVQMIPKLKIFNFHLSNLSLKNDQMNILGQYIQKMTQIQKLFLDIEGNQIDNIGFRGIMGSISKMGQLSRLQLNLLRNNNIKKEWVEILCSEVKKSEKIEVLEIDMQSLEANSAQGIFKQIKECNKNLKQLQLYLI